MLNNRLMKMGACIAMLALAFVASVPIVANAANTNPTDFYFDFNGNDPYGSVDHTHMRNKTNGSLAYAMATDLTSGIYVGVAGINNYSLAVTNRTDNTYAYFRSVNQPSSIYNTVYSSNEYFAWFWVYKNSEVPDFFRYIFGEWSPDSLATYTIINAGY